MIEKVGQSNLLDRCDQVVIYGANGWMGRSALDFLSSISPSVTKRKVLLIGSRSSNLEIGNEIFEINDPVVSGEESLRIRKMWGKMYFKL